MPIYLQYYFWLAAVSVFCFLLERIKPWRPEQKAFRKGFWQDVFWLVFNGHYVGVIIAIIGTLIGHLNHSNLSISWGPLKYLLNSPRMHIWHHDVVVHGNGGQNFGITLSVWDWLFGTVYMPEQGRPESLGFAGMESFPRHLFARMFYPFYKWLPNIGKRE